MKSLLIIFFLSFCLVSLSAQEKHFVFIQSDNNQPFYVSLNGKLYSSTATGFIIIPKLTDGDYNFSIGFAKNAFPEQSFQYTINNKDLGFNLKNFGEKGWGLFNLQTLDVTMAESGKTNEISKALSEKDVAKEEPDPVISFDRKKKDTTAAQTATQTPEDALANKQITNNEKQKDAEAKADSAIAADKENNSLSSDHTVANADIKIDEPVAAASASGIKKVSESKEDDGLHLAYVESNNKNTDTIQIIIPANKSASNTENNTSLSKEDASKTEVAASTKPAKSKSDKADEDSLKFLDVNMNSSEKNMNKEEPGQEEKLTVITNSKCTNIATDEDYTRLRRKMAMATTDGKMITEAKKMYRNKCFTTNQIKRLSTLFLSDEGRYNFFNASYNSVADVSEYSALQSEFIDPAFVDRFKAMLK